MPHMKNKQDCCGCAACVQVCPNSCITMRQDREGFWYPETDYVRCINCGLCQRVCPMAGGSYTQKALLPADGCVWIAYCTDEMIRENSSSGGVFSVLAEAILDAGGVVFGCAFDEDFSVHHIAITSKEEIAQLRGSKYVQSRIENTYTEAEEYLRQGRYVLYTGTACQIAGLKAYLRKDYDTLLTTDVLCHGVPSPAVWKHYLQELQNQKHTKISGISFRDKRNGWRKYSLRIRFENGIDQVKPTGDDPYMKLFLSNICLRPSCYHCHFKGTERLSDLTIGDAWGIDHHSPEMDDNRGASTVWLHTAKGSRFWNTVSSRFCVKSIPLDVAIPPNADARKSVSPHKNRTVFFKMLGDGAEINESLVLIRPTFWERCKKRIPGWVKKIVHR